jgi:sialate O-acetylesterase
VTPGNLAATGEGKSEQQPEMKHLFTIFIALLLAPLAELPAAPAQKPNLVLILADDMGWGDLRCHGNEKLDTPALDKLQSQSVDLDHFYVSPVCSPTRSSLLTGRHHFRLRVLNTTSGLETLHGEEMTLAEALKPAGYVSGCFGKWHNGANHPTTARGQGFDEFFGFVGGFFSNYFDPELEHDGVTVVRKGFITDVLADAAMAFIEKHRAQPFFCYVPFNACHSPMQAPDDLFAKYSALRFEPKTAAVYAMIENLDANVGRLLGKIDALGLAENTIVMFASDNGPNTPRFNGGMRGGKGSLFEGGQRVPCFLRWPGKLQAGKRVSRIAQHVDVLPTLLDLAGVPLPATPSLDGVSLAPLLRGEAEKWPERLLFEVSGRGGEDGTPIPKYPGTLRSDTHRWVHDGKAEMLFDLRSDPGEKNNIAAQYPETAATLSKAYDTWFADATASTQGKVQRFPITLADGTELLAPFATLEGGAKFFGQGWDNDWAVFSTPTSTITWNLEVPQAGTYEVIALHTAKEPEGKIKATVGERFVEAPAATTHNPPVIPRRDLVPRWEVPDKAFAPMKLGTLRIPSGLQNLRITAAPGIGIQSVRLNRADDPDAHLPRRVSTTPTPRAEPAAWMEKVERHVALAKRGGWEVVLVGDSITDGWRSTGKKAWDSLYPGHQPLNLGMIADKTENVLWRLDHGQLEGYHPKVFVVMIGTNNVGHRPPHLESADDTVAGVKAILDRIAGAAPGAKVILMGILPRGESAEDARRQRIEALNPQLQRLADNQRVHWLDLWSEFLRADGTFVPGLVTSDLLHLTERGYEVWARAMQPLMVRLLRGEATDALRLPSIFSDHMVLQCDHAVPVWGRAEPDAEVTVEFAGQTRTTTTGAAGKWTVKLDPLTATGEPREMRIRTAGGESRIIRDVIVGEVWAGGGQSNMEFDMKAITNAAAEIDASANPMLRQFHVAKTPAARTPADDVQGYWSVARPGTTEDFIAAGYFFAKSIQRELRTPVGLIKVCWGGSKVEPWISPASLASVPELAAGAKNMDAMSERNKNAFRDWLKQTQREDRPSGDVASFIGGPVSKDNGWVAVKDSGPVSDPALPKFGAFWFRKEVTLTARQTGAVQILQFGPSAQFDQVYWNGTLIGERTVENFTGLISVRHYLIPPALLKEGMNQLAVRLFAPAEPPGFSWFPSVGTTKILGGWMAKSEYALPPLDPAAKKAVPPLTGQHVLPGRLFNGMVHPILTYGIRGVLWYQGESNTGNASLYRTSFPLLIEDWRQHWQQGDFPFYFCQLANYRTKTDQPGESVWADLRESQAKTLSVPNTGMAVLIDTGESEDIHPQTKETVGERLAKIALAKTYGKAIPFSGPVYEAMQVEGDRIRLSFRHLEGGLVARELPATYDVMRKTGKTAPLVRNRPDSQLEGFAICGANEKWVWADAKIDGETVLVWSDQITDPVAARYAWADNPTCNLYNAAGLPASPFRTDKP